ncbi:putative RNA-directed DNA polymerase from transposon BS [Trichonephila clavipes]|nr:putative RNA-directed DNA polymerase from transposon BS [Trichonephila clavipes]
METGFSKFFRSSVRDAEIILRAGQRIISEINILVENSQGSSQIPKSNPQLLNAEIKKKIARHENIKNFAKKTAICINCGVSHSGQCSNNSRCINSKGDHPANSLNCPEYVKEKILELKCEQHILHWEKREGSGTIKGHLILQKDREDRSGGGLLIAVSSNISAQQIPIQIQQTRELEILAIKIHVRNISFYIVNIYAPRGFNIIIIKSFLESLMAPMIIFGDFNLHHPMWGSDHISRYSNEFVEWITDSNLVLLNTTVPTYRSSAGAASLIDLSLFFKHVWILQ